MVWYGVSVWYVGENVGVGECGCGYEVGEDEWCGCAVWEDAGVWLGLRGCRGVGLGLGCGEREGLLLEDRGGGIWVGLGVG